MRRRFIDPRSRPWLAPLGTLFGAAAALRVGLYRRGALPQVRLRGPVISVGNLALGGRGKTPAVAWIAAFLRDGGFAVAVLSRGYGGHFTGDALVVSDGAQVLASAAEAGDEPVMLARDLPGVVVAVGRARGRVGRLVEARFGSCVHVLDDGFQHLALARDLDVVCIDEADVHDRPLPAGSLRELPSALGRADVVLVTNGVAPAEPPGRAFAVHRAPDGFVDLRGLACPAPARAVLLSGVARPERFEADVRAVGVDVRAHLAFGDHHPFTTRELERAQVVAGEAGADAIVTTAKDAVRLEAWAPRAAIVVFRIRMAVDGEAAFRERLMSVAGSRS